ncbi:unnamed protein product [[Candida] boidinii]|nr:hypothetical protein BVG19_g4080 [[Candida] boidinii]OWB52923.1 hypothetical protein B5S27_g4506 [[Candida] boidinii]GMF06695.1 unnamed protein product [[Candida] boidinii]
MGSSGDKVTKIVSETTNGVVDKTQNTINGLANEIPQRERSHIAETIYQISSTPFAAWAFTSGLVASPMFKSASLRPATPVGTGYGYGSGSSVVGFFSKKPISPYPNNASVLLFGAMTALGGFMIYDNDPENGSGVIAAWSSLYAIMNTRKAVFSWKLWPKALVLCALGNSAVYGSRFFGFV